MVGSHVGHDSVVGHHVIMANNCLLGGHVQVDDRANLGGASIFHQGIRVGKLTMIRGGTRLSKNVPPYLVSGDTNLVTSLNVVGMRRAGMNSEVRQEIKRAFKLLYCEGLNVSQALEAASKETWLPEAQAFFEFIGHSSKKGICALRAARRKESNEDEV